MSFCRRKTLSLKTWCRLHKIVTKNLFYLLCNRITLSWKEWFRLPKINKKQLSCFCLKLALICILFFYFAIQDSLHVLIVVCISGLRWFVYSYCLLQFRVALVCGWAFALLCVFLLCFASQGCASLSNLVAFFEFRFVLVWYLYSTE